MSLLHVAILAVVQGLAELLPVSSSAHVIVAEKLMGLDPSSPPMTLLLIMLHTGTMLAVIVYFHDRWRQTYFRSPAAFTSFARNILLASVLSGVIGGGLIEAVERVALRHAPQAQIEDLFGRLELIAPALALVGILMIFADTRSTKERAVLGNESAISATQAAVIGTVQGISLPFRGFSRSGSTISAGILSGTARSQAENFSFALAVVLTPAAIGRELLRLVHSQKLGDLPAIRSVLLPSLLGTLLSFLAGLLALKWLSRWLEEGRWYLFGIYCVLFAGVVAALHNLGY